jgi:hypothetical protein
MEKRNCRKEAYLLNVIASFIFILSLFFNAFLIEVKYEENSSGLKSTYSLHSVYEVITSEGSLGLIDISLGVAAVVLVIIGVFLGLKKFKLSQIFVSSGITFAFLQLSASLVSVNNEIYVANKENASAGVLELVKETSIMPRLGFFLALVAFILVLVSAFFFLQEDLPIAKQEEAVVSKINIIEYADGTKPNNATMEEINFDDVDL